jgi:hypothetical protein
MRENEKMQISILRFAVVVIVVHYCVIPSIGLFSATVVESPY